MNLPNQDQVLGALRWIITTGGAFAVGRGWITADQVPLLLGAAATLIPLIWSVFFVHTDAGKVSAAAATPGVAAVVLKSSEAAEANPSANVVGPEALK